MTYTLIIKDAAINGLEYLPAGNAKLVFDLGQQALEQGYEITAIKSTGKDDVPITVNQIKDSLLNKAG